MCKIDHSSQNDDEPQAPSETQEKPSLLSRLCKKFWRYTSKTGEMDRKPFKGIL